MARNDVNFPYVRANADFEAVLSQFGIKTIGEGTQKKALCPFHDDTKPSLEINTEKKVFNCFACGVSGNVLDFVAKKEEINIRMSAIKVAEICGIATRPDGKVLKNGKATTNKRVLKKSKEDFGDVEPVELDVEAVNKPLTFELKLDIQPYHPWLVERDMSPGKIEEFGVGLALRGSMKDRLAIPIHNLNNELVAYCGRDIGLLDDPDEPKYKLPKDFHKDLEVFGLNRVPDGRDIVLMVESYLSVIQHSKPSVGVVSPMGLSISMQQIERLKERGITRVAILFDGDDPGRKGAEQVAIALARAGIWTKIGDVPDGHKPHQMSYNEMIACFKD